MPDTSGHPQTPMTASQRLAAALGRPRPEPLSGERLRDFERRQDEADAQIERLYGQRPVA